MSILMPVWPPIHEVESDVQRIDIRIITIVDQRATSYSLFDLQTHCHRFKVSHPLGYNILRQMEIQTNSKAMDRILDRSIVHKRYIKTAVITQVRILDMCGVVHTFHLTHEQRHSVVL